MGTCFRRQVCGPSSSGEPGTRAYPQNFANFFFTEHRLGGFWNCEPPTEGQLFEVA